MSSMEKLAIYRKILDACKATLADVPEQWRMWPSMDLRERQDYMLYQIDDAIRRIADIEADASDLGPDEKAGLTAAKQQWEKVEPILQQMERSFDEVQDTEVDAA